WNVPATQGAFLWVIGHVQEFPAVFARRAYINQRFVRLDVLHDLTTEGPNLQVRSARCVRDCPIAGPHLGQRSAFVDPLLPPAVHDAAISMPIELKDPESIAGPPVVAVTVKDHGVIVADPFATHERGEGAFVDVVADDLMLQLAVPVDLDSTGDVADVMQQDILIRLDDTDSWVVEMLRDPFSAHQDFGVSVLCHDVFLLHTSRIVQKQRICLAMLHCPLSPWERGLGANLTTPCHATRCA